MTQNDTSTVDATETVRDRMRAVLQNNICEVQFTKADGTLRTMRCTLKPEALPPLKTDGTQRAENLEIIPVWDVEAEGWRSFRIDAVKSFGTVIKTEVTAVSLEPS